MMWLTCSANYAVGVWRWQMDRNSRHVQRQGGTGPVKIDEEGYLIYKDGDILFERCTHHCHHFIVAITLQLLLVCTLLRVNYFSHIASRHCSMIECSTCLGIPVGAHS